MHILKETKSLLATLEKMNQKIISQLSFFIFLFVIVLAFGISSALTVISKFEKNRVQIFSNLDNRVLFYHCKSKDNDLGLRNLLSGEYWEFSLFTKTFLHQRSSSAIFGTLTIPKLSSMLFSMYLQQLLNSLRIAANIIAFGQQKMYEGKSCLMCGLKQPCLILPCIINKREIIFFS